MENAVPLMTKIDKNQISDINRAMPDGPAGIIPGKLPDQKYADNSSIDWSGEVNPYSEYPYSTVGKIFFRQRDIYGTFFSAVCSGAVIRENEVWTAGHCVHRGSGLEFGWSTDMVFVPQYYDGYAPCGQWTITQAKTTSDWYNNGTRDGLDPDHDYAKVLVSNPNTACTGILGFAYNQDYNQQYLSVGYPAEDPYNGQRMIFCWSTLLKLGIGSPATYGISCPMNGGTSGGPFIINGNALNGTNSYIVPGANELYSPYFNSDTKSFYDSGF
ncbi:MAG: hypothetical protein GFH25_541190n314 [Chloroflexi bacterium AL-N10]|nr:hypothetical protein [Chloroflexi bacterium AL-N1]NOK67474.1 hypothetical protein [Chloroflexi bacterium AL-N10]NOK75034.1 hypothetical protein [Chloroflexi bacterium AL-N5]NOK89667.1 hypothetical protein [Chloroflexi bacterium AL-N15]